VWRDLRDDLPGLLIGVAVGIILTIGALLMGRACEPEWGPSEYRHTRGQ